MHADLHSFESKKLLHAFTESSFNVPLPSFALLLSINNETKKIYVMNEISLNIQASVTVVN